MAALRPALPSGQLAPSYTTVQLTLTSAALGGTQAALLQGSGGLFAEVYLYTDGVQDIGERGVAGVTVELLAGYSGTTVLRTRTTNANGDYLFSALAAGQYRIRVVAPTERTFTLQAAIPDDDYDSDVGSNGISSCVTVGASEENYRLDAGLL